MDFTFDKEAALKRWDIRLRSFIQENLDYEKVSPYHKEYTSDITLEDKIRYCKYMKDIINDKDVPPFKFNK